MGDAIVVPLAPHSNGPCTVELRWGITERDIDCVRALHEEAFPLHYHPSYYAWLLSESCVALVARVASNDATRSEEDTCAVAEESQTCSSSGEAHRTIVGFCVGQVARGRYHNGHFAPNPTGYLCSFAVKSSLQCCGIGETLLRHFLTYMHYCIPVPSLLHPIWQAPMDRGTRRSDVATRAARARHLFKFPGWTSYLETKGLLDGRPTEDVPSPVGEAMSARDVTIERGLKEVWLHCLASKKKLIQFYVKRGFVCIRLVPEFYEFDGSFHDGMLLVCRRDVSFAAPPERTSMKAPQRSTTSAFNFTVGESTPLMASQETDNSWSCIVDIDLGNGFGYLTHEKDCANVFNCGSYFGVAYQGVTCVILFVIVVALGLSFAKATMASTCERKECASDTLR
ncbi:putative Acetyltransferase (GNAT) family [Trypanosoma vivax]|nr:putative acetyltransferase [Trypanosoma vivax]KAH8611237.1 putative Acetyltransferase (GNAT) family [Trypanosoma vivax]